MVCIIPPYHLTLTDNTLEVDQPVGTGFSYTSTDQYVHSLPEASKQFVQFLRTWYKVFPEYITMDVCILFFMIVH